jgi:hypothetical protein
VFGAVRVLGGAKQTSKGLAWCRVLSKQARVWCLVLCLVLCGAKLTSKGLGASAWCPVWVLSKQARIRCGFPSRKSISVRTRIQVERAGCGQFRVRCCAGAVPSKQASK